MDLSAERHAPGLRQRRSRVPTLILNGAIEGALLSPSGFIFIRGWLADEGCDEPSCRIDSGGGSVALPGTGVLRYARLDVETSLSVAAYDYGFVLFGSLPDRWRPQQHFRLEMRYAAASFEAGGAFELTSDKRVLDTLLSAIKTSSCHAGREACLYGFLAQSAGAAALELFRQHVAASSQGYYVHRFKPRPVSRSFVTVLFGSTEPLRLQPVLFLHNSIDFGEWIYVCNSPEEAAAALRLGRLMAELYDVMITIIIMPDNVGFGAANNIAVGQAASDRIYLVNPDVYPIPAYAGQLRQALEQADLGRSLRGGLLFYDEYTLMHSGMYLERDTYFRRAGPGAADDRAVATVVHLLRVEHFDKGVPFEGAQWLGPASVPAVTGALMAFARPCFERIGGFSDRYIYGHYEDADLSLRWVEGNGPVIVDPNLRLVHLEGQGARAQGEHYQGAAIANCFFFSLRHLQAFEGAADRSARAPGMHRSGAGLRNEP